MKTLVMAMMVWAAGQMGVPVPEQPPVVEFQSYEELWATAGLPAERFAPVSAEQPNPQRVFGHHRGGRIWLAEDFDPDDPYWQSVVLHEVIHYLQLGSRFKCRGSMERQAYNLQDRWLRQQKRSIYYEDDPRPDRLFSENKWRLEARTACGLGGG